MTDLIGQSLGRYHILEQLGEGGMATVYKAYDTRLETDVAVKVIRTENILPNALARALKRFEREAKSLARLTHPNVVSVKDYGEYEGKPYLVMEYLPGGTLKQRLGAPMPWQEAVKLLLPVAGALEYAHEHKLIHRDIKPSNILLTEKGQPMLTDFGIAKLLDLEETQDLTGTGMGIGTPEYMAPEQWMGKTSTQSDQYSLGVVLYEMLTGRKPYTADTPAAILLKQATDPLPRPAQFNRNIPDKVEKFLIKALAKDPLDRYPGMREFSTAMEFLLSGLTQTVKAPPTGKIEQTIEASTASRIETDFMTMKEPPTRDIPSTPMGGRTNIAKVLRYWQIGLLGMVIVGGLLILLRSIGGGAVPAPATAPPEGVPPVLITTPLEMVTNSQPMEVPTETPRAISLPVSRGEPLPPLEVISPENAGSISLLASWTEDGLGSLVSMALSPDGSMITAGGYDNAIWIWNIADRSLLTKLFGHSSVVSSLSFSPDGSQLASGSWDGTVRVWNVLSWEQSYSITPQHSEGLTNSVDGLAFSPDGSKLAICTGGTISVRNAASGASVREISDGSLGNLYGCVFSPGGEYLASAGYNDSRIRLWDTSTWQNIHSFSGHTSSATSVDFSRDGNFLVSGGDETVRLWDLNNRQPLAVFIGHSAWVVCVAFSPDGRIIASGADDNNLRLWDVNSKGLINSLEHSARVYKVAFSPDGTFIATVSMDNTIRLWGVPNLP